MFSQIYLGPIFGFNASKVRYDNEYYNESLKAFQKFRVGINSGFLTYFYFGKVMDVRAETIFTQKGFSFNDTYTSGYKVFGFAEENVAGQLDLNYDSKVMVSPYLGYFGAYWLYGKRKYFDYKNDIYITDKIYLKNDTIFEYNRIDLGLIAGVDFKYKLSKKQILTFGFKYEFSLLSSAKNKVDGWKNRNISIFLAYNFKISKR